MFTEKDYRDYFTIIQETEKKMLSSVDKIISAISDPAIQRILIDIHNVELRHLQLEDELFTILEEQIVAVKN